MTRILLVYDKRGEKEYKDREKDYKANGGRLAKLFEIKKEKN